MSLNPNHTHFLLVDDGIRGKYQGVADFRANLESRLAGESWSQIVFVRFSVIPVLLKGPWFIQLVDD